MNRRSFIKTAVLGIVGLATGWGLLKPTCKWMPGHVLNYMRNHSKTTSGTLYLSPAWNHARNNIQTSEITIKLACPIKYPDVFRVMHYPGEGQSWEDFFSQKP